MSKKLILPYLIIGLIVAVSPALANITIDFETLADLENVDNQFLALGADFNGDATAANLSLNVIYPPFSGNTAIVDNIGGTGTIRVDAVGMEWQMAGAYVTGNTDITLSAYASDGTLLGTDNTGGANFIGAGTGIPNNKWLSVSTWGISYVEFTDAGNTYTVDDFTFAKVPAPGAILLGSIGVGVVGWLRRRRTL